MLKAMRPIVAKQPEKEKRQVLETAIYLRVARKTAKEIKDVLSYKRLGHLVTLANLPAHTINTILARIQN